MNTKEYFIDYEDFENNNRVEELAKEILNDEELSTLDEIIIGDWLAYEYSVQPILDMIVENKEKFQHIKSFFIGNIEFDECEVSWIIQGNYGKFLKNLPNLEHLKIKGSNELELNAQEQIYLKKYTHKSIKSKYKSLNERNLNHNKLKSLEIICGGLPSDIIKEISKANFPNLEKLNLYIGVERYGFDGDIEDIKKLVNSLGKFKNLKYLGINNSYIQDEIVEVVLQSDIIKQLEVLDFSNGTLTDKGGQLILNSRKNFLNLKFLDLHYHFLSNEMMYKLRNLPFKVNLDEQNENDKEYGNYPMLTE